MPTGKGQIQSGCKGQQPKVRAYDTPGVTGIITVKNVPTPPCANGVCIEYTIDSDGVYTYLKKIDCPT